MSDVFGQSSYGGNYKKKTYFKLKDGESVYRILPALGELAAEGRWSVFWKVHYGYKNSKGQLRTFESSLVKNNNSKMIEVPDAALERIEKMKAEFEAAKKAGDAGKIALFDKFVGQKGMYNLDSNHYLNVIDQAGNVGILKIRHRCKVALDDEIKRLRGLNIDPLSPDNGRYFVFRRSGMGLDTTFKVTVLQETVEVPGFGPMQRDLVHKLTAEIAARCGSWKGNKFQYSEAANLSTLYKKPTAEQIARIVKESDVMTGKSPAVDEIFDAKASGGTEGGTGGEEGFDDTGDYEDAGPAAAAAPQAAAPTPAPVAAAPAPVQAAPSPAPVQTLAEPPKASAPAPAPAPAAEQESDADFLKSLGL